MAKCTAITQAKKKCEAWAGGGGTKCRAHGGRKKKPGAPKNNQNAKKHGFYSQDMPPETIDEVFDGLAKKQALLESYIEKNLYDLDLNGLVALLSLHAQTASRLARILRDRQAAGGADQSEINKAIFQILKDMKLNENLENEL